MVNLINILYFCDILGLEPKLRIFDLDTYKSTFSSILSIIILFLAATFTVYSLIVYFNYVNPSIVYSKDNDKSTSRSIQISETLLMLGLYENSKFSVVQTDDAFIEAEYVVEFKNGTQNKYNLNMENCEYGKNIDEKYQDSLKNYKISDYYCFSNLQGNWPLFYIPDVGKSSLSLNIRLGEYSKYTANDLIFYILNGNDIIDHTSKNNPISNNYFTSTYTSFSPNKFNVINYYLQFIKYESDDGFLFPNSHIFNAKAFSQMTIMETNYIQAMDKNEIGRVFISFSEINFDYYKRVYPRIQSLLAEISSVVNLLLIIGQIITKFILDKKMTKDIFKYINKKEFSQRKIETTSENKEIISKDVNIRASNDIENIKDKQNINSYDFISNKNENNDIKENVFNDLNYLDIIKSFFCCEDEKTRLINSCHSYISKEICIEKILHKLSELEYKMSIISSSNTLKFGNKGIEDIKNLGDNKINT